MKLYSFILCPCLFLAVMFCLQSLLDAALQDSNFPPTYILIYAKCRLEIVAQKSIYAAPLLDKPISSLVIQSVCHAVSDEKGRQNPIFNNQYWKSAKWLDFQ